MVVPLTQSLQLSMCFSLWLGLVGSGLSGSK